jgi:hypothetical protein
MDVLAPEHEPKYVWGLEPAAEEARSAAAWEAPLAVEQIELG